MGMLLCSQLLEERVPLKLEFWKFEVWYEHEKNNWNVGVCDVIEAI